MNKLAVLQYIYFFFLKDIILSTDFFFCSDLEFLSLSSVSGSAVAFAAFLVVLDGLDGSFCFDDGLLAGLSGFALGLDGGLLVKSLDLDLDGGCGFVLGGLGGVFLLTDESVTSNPSCIIAPGSGRRGPTYLRKVSSTLCFSGVLEIVAATSSIEACRALFPLIEAN
jgi:hypothetical protein